MLRVITIISTLLVVACQASNPVKSFSGASDVNRITEEESRLWNQAKKFDKALVSNDSIYVDEHVNAYVQSVMDRVYPGFVGKIKVKLIRDPYLNAFALPNGSIYFNIGLLARLDNEAQLATILAHEGAHFIHKHGLKQRRNIKAASAFSLIVGSLGGGMIARIAAVSSVYGFSRNLEREADKEAFIHMKKAGYDVHQAPEAFKKLLAESKAHKQKHPWFFASHPKLQNRIDTYNELIKKAGVTKGDIGRKDYQHAMQDLRIADLKANLSSGRYASIILILENDKTRKVYPSYAQFYLGEAYRQRGAKGDDYKSYIAYLKAVDKAPKFAPSYRALGIHYMKSKRYTEAREVFSKYLKLAPTQTDVAYVREYLQEIQNK